MKNLSHSPSLTSANDSKPAEEVSSIFSFEDLSETDLFSDYLKVTKSFILFVVVVAAAGASYLLLSGCVHKCRWSSRSTMASSVTFPVQKNLDPLSISVAAMYSELKESPLAFGTPRSIDGFENLQITFLKVRMLTNYIVGDTRFLSLSYKKNQLWHTLNAPLSNESSLLFYDGQLTSKPYFISAGDLPKVLLPGQKFDLGVLTGALPESKESCSDHEGLCNILDVYSNNRAQVDEVLKLNSLQESTQTIPLPIYFVGVTN
jgi:hypothetical protein